MKLANSAVPCEMRLQLASHRSLSCLPSSYFSYNAGVVWPGPLPLAYRACTKMNAQFYAPTKASEKEFWLSPAIFLRLSVLSKSGALLG